MWISRKHYNFLMENAEKNIDAECEILREKDKYNRASARLIEEYSAILKERDELRVRIAALEHRLGADPNRNCINCIKNGWHMPECAECEPENNFKWFAGK